MIPEYVIAGLWGLLSGSGLLVGAVLADVLYGRLTHRMISAVMGFGGGVLIAVVATELIGDRVSADRVRLAIAEAFNAGGETAAALIAIGHAPGMSIGQVRQTLRLSHAGAVRVVERLGEQGLVAKSPSPSDRRVVHVSLTSRGQVERTKLLGLRNAAVSELLSKVSADDRVVLERAADNILSSLFSDLHGGLAICRLCDQARCADCPVGHHRP